MQWSSLVILMLGVAAVQLQGTDSGKSTAAAGSHTNLVKGMAAVITSCIMSGFAGVYFEKILKGSTQSVWLRNVQLGFLGTILGKVCVLFSAYHVNVILEQVNKKSVALPTNVLIYKIFFIIGRTHVYRHYYYYYMLSGLITLGLKDGTKVREQGFFFGYDWAVWLAILLNSVGGLLVAVVVKYADNILKGFATSGAIILSCIISIYFFNFQLTIQFVIGASLVISSVYLYGSYPYVAPSPKPESPAV